MEVLPSLSLQPMDVENLDNLLNCPVELERLKLAVTLVPCAHKINENIAKRLLKPECPICKMEITDKIIDHDFRQIVEIINKIPLEKLMALAQPDPIEKMEVAKTNQIEPNDKTDGLIEVTFLNDPIASLRFFYWLGNRPTLLKFLSIFGGCLSINQPSPRNGHRNIEIHASGTLF